MNFTALKFEPHTVLKAYSVLYGELPGGSTLFLDRKSLRKQWEARARGLSQTQSPGSWGRAAQREDTLDFEELDWAYRSLLDLLGGRDQALVSAWACENIEAVNAVLHKGRNLLTTRRTAPGKAVPAAASASNGARLDAGTRVEHSHPVAPIAPPSPIAPPETATRDFDPPRVAVTAPGPRVRPMFGRFLLARGHITLQQLIDAVRWQRAQRPPVGRIAMNWGILSANQVYEVLSDKKPQDRFCDVAVRKGFMTGYQRLAVLGRQREMQKPIGSYFVEHGILSRDEIEGLAAEAKSQ